MKRALLLLPLLLASCIESPVQVPETPNPLPWYPPGMAISKPSEFPDWATNGFPTAIDQPYASAGRIATGWEGDDEPSPKTQNGLHYWTAKHLEYLEQDTIQDKVAGRGFVVISGAPTVNSNTMSLTLNPSDDVQIDIPLKTGFAVSQVRVRHKDAQSGITTGLLFFQPGYARDDSTTAIDTPPAFPNSANVWVWDSYVFTPDPYEHAADTDVLEFLVQNQGDNDVTIQKYEITYTRI